MATFTVFRKALDLEPLGFRLTNPEAGPNNLNVVSGDFSAWLASTEPGTNCAGYYINGPDGSIDPSDLDAVIDGELGRDYIPDLGDYDYPDFLAFLFAIAQMQDSHIGQIIKTYNTPASVIEFFPGPENFTLETNIYLVPYGTNIGAPFPLATRCYCYRFYNNAGQTFYDYYELYGGVIVDSVSGSLATWAPVWATFCADREVPDINKDVYEIDFDICDSFIAENGNWPSFGGFAEPDYYFVTPTYSGSPYSELYFQEAGDIPPIPTPENPTAFNYPEPGNETQATQFQRWQSPPFKTRMNFQNYCRSVPGITLFKKG